MILFVNTANRTNSVVPYKELSDIKILEINFLNKYLTDYKMLEVIRDMLDTLQYESDKFLLVINDLDDAFANLELNSDNFDDIVYSKWLVSTFRSLINDYIKIGHEIVYFTNKNERIDDNIALLDELDGFEIITDEVKLYNKLIKNIQ